MILTTVSEGGVKSNSLHRDGVEVTTDGVGTSEND